MPVMVRKELLDKCCYTFMSLGDATFATHMSCIHGSQYSDHDISDRVMTESNGYCEDDNFNTDDYDYYISDDGGFNYYEDHTE